MRAGEGPLFLGLAWNDKLAQLRQPIVVSRLPGLLQQLNDEFSASLSPSHYDPRQQPCPCTDPEFLNPSPQLFQSKISEDQFRPLQQSDSPLLFKQPHKAGIGRYQPNTYRTQSKPGSKQTDMAEGLAIKLKEGPHTSNSGTPHKPSTDLRCWAMQSDTLGSTPFGKSPPGGRSSGPWGHLL